VCVAVNNFNGWSSDGEKGAFLGALKCPEGNYMHVVTADGRVLHAGHLNGVSGDVFGTLGKALARWRALPASVRQPGAVEVPAPKSPPRQELIQPPKGGLILRVYQRNMKRDAGGEVALITREDVKDRKLFPDEAWRWGDGVMIEPMGDVMWLTEVEWRALVPARPRKWDRLDVPAAIKMRLFRYHLINGTYGLPEAWWPGEVLRGELTLQVEEVSPVVRLRLRGSALMAADGDLAKARRGYDTRLTGLLEYDPRKRAFSRFDVVSVGDWWGGETHYGRFVRPGRVPLGIAFELAQGDRVGDLVPPKGQRYSDIVNHYFVAEKK
jgi:hypothetical protein